MSDSLFQLSRLQPDPVKDRGRSHYRDRMTDRGMEWHAAIAIFWYFSALFMPHRQDEITRCHKTILLHSTWAWCYFLLSKHAGSPAILITIRWTAASGDVVHLFTSCWMLLQDSIRLEYDRCWIKWIGEIRGERCFAKYDFIQFVDDFSCLVHGNVWTFVVMFHCYEYGLHNFYPEWFHVNHTAFEMFIEFSRNYFKNKCAGVDIGTQQKRIGGLTF